MEMDNRPLTNTDLAIWRALVVSCRTRVFLFARFHELLRNFGVVSYEYDLTTGVLGYFSSSSVSGVLLPPARKMNAEFPLASPRWSGGVDARALERAVAVLEGGGGEMTFEKVIQTLIAAGVKEMEGRPTSGRVSFVGSDGEGIWHDFGNEEMTLAGTVEEMRLVEATWDEDKENDSCVANREGVAVEARGGEDGVPLGRAALQPREDAVVGEAPSAYTDLAGIVEEDGL